MNTPQIIHGVLEPYLIPFCASCDEPVDRFTVYHQKVDGSVEIEAQCHGHTQGIRLPVEEVARLAASNGGGKIVMFRRAQGFDSVR